MAKRKPKAKSTRARGKPKPYKQQNSNLPAGQLADAHDAKFDLDTLTRAQEIRANKMRHGAAMTEAQRKRSILSSVMDGKPARDEMEMRRYAKRRGAPTRA